MKSPVLYILEVLFCSGLLLAFYRLLLVRNVSYVHCRRYLVAAVVLSLVLPALSIPVYPARAVVYSLPVIPVFESEPPVVSVTDTIYPQMVSTDVAEAPAGIDWPRIARIFVVGLYLLTVVVSLTLFVVRLIHIRRLRRRSHLSDCGDYTLAENPAVAMPFSFLRTVFLGEGYRGRSRDIVLRHEASHVRHRHSVERIVIELVRCLVWFNPFVWIAQRWLQEVQEWEADRDVLDAGYDLTEYRTIIFHQHFGYNPDIACGLNHSLTKNRFTMMTFRKERRQTLLRFAAVVPVLAGMMMLCSFTTRAPEQPVSGAATVETPVQPVLPGLENLKPIPTHESMISIVLPVDGKPLTFDCMQYLPVNDAKYRYDSKSGKVTDLKGTDISQWAMKHYYVKATNPLFWVNGVRMDKSTYAAYSEQRRVDKTKKEASNQHIYAGPEVGKLLGDSTVDALVVIETGEKTPAATATATAPEFYCPLQSRTVGAFGRQAPMSDYKHTGVDLMADKGAPIVAAADGTVTFAGVDGGYGNCVRIDHAWGYSTMYAHLERIDVKQGERVRGGQTIGTVGTTGRTTGPHLHFELAKDGERIDPAHVFDFATGGMRKDAVFTVKESSASMSDNLLIEVGAQGVMRVDGIPTSPDKLLERIAAWRETIKDPGQARVVIRVDRQTKMGAVTDLKQSLRQVKALRINYSLDGQSDVMRILPPTPQTSRDEHGVTVVEMKIKARNLFLVLISGKGSVLAGQMGKQEIISPDKLTEQIKAFVLNTAGSAALPEMNDEEFLLPDGRKVTYPVSEGFVSLQTTRDTPYETYIEVQQFIIKAFDEIRDEVAHKWFGTAFANLSEPQQQLVMRVVPLKLSEAEPHNAAKNK